MKFWVDGKATEVIAVDDVALWRGLAVFETLRTYDRRLFAVEDHLARLMGSAAVMGIDVPVTLRTELEGAAVALSGEATVSALLSASGRRVVRSRRLDTAKVGRPIRCVTREWRPPAWFDGRIKHTNRAAWETASQGVDEVIWVSDGCYTEADRSNVFAIRDGVIWTAPDDGLILQGVTRAHLIAAARAAGLEVREAPVPVGPCDELYVASTLKELAPVAELDGVPLASTGPIGARLRALFLERVQSFLG